VRVRLVVDVHQLADGSVGIFLCRRERLVAEKFLNGAEVSSVSQQMRRERVAQRMRMQVPVDIGDANVFFDDSPDGALREPAARIIKEDRFGVRPLPVALLMRLLEKLFTQRPVFFERFLGLRPVRNDPFFVPFAADAQNAFLLLHVAKIKAGELADAQARGVKKFQKRPVAAKEHTFFDRGGMALPALRFQPRWRREQ